MPEQNLETRREEARRVMEGDERRKQREVREQTIGKRRIEARLAMESPTHRARREARDRAEREITGATQAKAGAEREAREAAARVVTEAKNKEEATRTAAHEELVARVNTARQSTAEINVLKNKPTHLTAIRTLKTDMVTAVSQGGSMAGTMIQEREREMGQMSAPARRPHTMLTIILTLVFLGTIASGGTLAYREWLANSPAPIVGPTSASGKLAFIPTDYQTAIDVTGQTVPELLGKIREVSASNQTPGTIDEIIFSKNKTLLTFRAWQTLLALPFPDGLLRNVEPTFMFGFYHGEAGSVPFILLKTKTTNQSYAQILAWEKNLPTVWDALIGKPPAPPLMTATSTAITAPNFRDLVIQNLDTRILEGTGIDQPALYGFLEANTIIFTQTRAAFLEALTRLRTRK